MNIHSYTGVYCVCCAFSLHVQLLALSDVVVVVVIIMTAVVALLLTQSILLAHCVQCSEHYTISFIWHIGKFELIFFRFFFSFPRQTFYHRCAFPVYTLSKQYDAIRIKCIFDNNDESQIAQTKCTCTKRLKQRCILIKINVNDAIEMAMQTVVAAHVMRCGPLCRYLSQAKRGRVHIKQTSISLWCKQRII